MYSVTAHLGDNGNSPDQESLWAAVTARQGNCRRCADDPLRASGLVVQVSLLVRSTLQDTAESCIGSILPQLLPQGGVMGVCRCPQVCRCSCACVDACVCLCAAPVWGHAWQDGALCLALVHQRDAAPYNGHQGVHCCAAGPPDTGVRAVTCCDPKGTCALCVYGMFSQTCGCIAARYA